MRVSKWGNSLAIRIPKDVAEALGIKEGDDVEVSAADGKSIDVARKPSRAELIERIRKLAKPLPPDWKFDREEANAR